MRIYWDSCAFLGLLNGELEKKRELEIVYGLARAGKIEIWTSTLAMIECKRLKSEEHQPTPLDDANEELIRNIFNQPFIKPIPVAIDIASSARQLWRKTKGLGKINDAVHLASAIRWNVEVMHTYDRQDLLHLSEMLNCKNDAPLKICYPDSTTDGALFEHAKQGRH